ncbi:MAG: menaquinone biosynthesis protein [Thermoanaerobaculales bacterium]|nr:menaquinone biosynthesis protein [Thermoanaerobaculales bacterium]
MSSEYTVAAVSFLNARPLIEGLDEEPGVHLISDVPSRLLETLIEDRASVALCPVIDFQLSPTELSIVLAGAIGSDGPTFTVRIFSRVPMEDVAYVHTDGDSHTSVALLAVIFDELYGEVPRIGTLESTDVNGSAAPPDSVLLIGDKVVRNQPDPALFPHQLDLGEAWRRMTGLPFVFACWMARADQDLGHLPRILGRYRDLNRDRTVEIAAAHGEASGWPEELAAEYLGEILRYEIGPREMEAIELFWLKCHNLGLIERLRPMKLYKGIEHGRG